MKQSINLLKKAVKSLLLSSVLWFGLSGCGTGYDPLDILDNSIPSLGPIVAGGAYSSYLTQTFSSSNPYWLFSTGFSGFYGGGYLAPARGIVSALGTTTISGVSGFYVTILHSGRMMTSIYGLQTPSMRVGDSVASGQVIGTFYSGSQVAFQVLLDGSAVCPLSYMNAEGRAGLSSWTPCQ